MATINATIKNAVLNVKNGRQVILTLDNGTTKWYPESYIRSVLTGADMEGARITSIIGTQVSYEKHNYAVGDAFVDDKGKVVTGNSAGVYQNAGVKLVNFTFGAVEGFTTDYDKAKMVATATANAVTKLNSLFNVKSAPKQIEQVAAESETSAEVVAEVVEDEISA